MGKKHLEYLLKDGAKAPSVTTILQVLNKPALNDWRARLGHKRSDEIKTVAGDFGGAVHAGIEAVCSDSQIPSYANDKIRAAVENFKQWAAKNIEEWVAFEKAAYHDDLRYAGTVDAFARLKNGKLVLIDFKTSRKVNWEYYLQTVAYARAQRYEDNVVQPQDIQGIIIVHLNHETMTWEALNVTDPDEEYWTIFQHLCFIYPRWRAANG